MSDQRLRQPIRRRSVLGRILIIFTGLIAIAWGIVTFPTFEHAVSVEQTADRVIAGEPYDPQIIMGQIPTANWLEKSKYCYPAGVRSAAIIRLRIFEVLTAAQAQHEVAPQIEPLIDTVHNSLACSPADPFLWLAMYALERKRVGLFAPQINYLRLSYRLGPNEAWIGLRRNPVAFADFQGLPPDLQNEAMNEFVGLLNFGFIHEMVDVFGGPGWEVHQLILARLKDVADRPRQAFADALYRRNFDTIVPGTIQPSERNWR